MDQAMTDLEMDLMLAQAENELLKKMLKERPKIVKCVECRHLYFKDLSAYCPHRVSACVPSGFCERGERRGEE